MSWLADTNILVYRFDARFPAKQAAARELLRRGLETGAVHLAHQCILEFVAATTRQRGDEPPILTRRDASEEAEAMLVQFPVLYPSEAVVRLAIRGAATYGLSWFDAHMWACAEHYGMKTLFSEDFQHDRLYGMVRAVNPFVSEPG